MSPNVQLRSPAHLQASELNPEPDVSQGVQVTFWRRGRRSRWRPWLPGEHSASRPRRDPRRRHRRRCHPARHRAEARIVAKGEGDLVPPNCASARSPTADRTSVKLVDQPPKGRRLQSDTTELDNWAALERLWFLLSTTVPPNRKRWWCKHRKSQNEQKDACKRQGHFDSQKYIAQNGKTCIPQNPKITRNPQILNMKTIETKANINMNEASAKFLLSNQQQRSIIWQWLGSLAVQYMARLDRERHKSAPLKRHEKKFVHL